MYTSLLSGEPAAVDREDMAVHKIGSFGGEEDDRAEKIIQLTQTLHWNATENPFLFNRVI
jgi:hypothetical protein